MLSTICVVLPLMNAAVMKMLDEMGIPKDNVRFDDFGG